MENIDKRQVEYILNRLKTLEEEVGVLKKRFALEEYFTVQEVANSLKLTPLTIQTKIHNGEIRAIKAGKEFRISRTDLDNYILSLSE